MSKFVKNHLHLCRSALAFIALMLAFSVAAFSQATKGTLRGTIVDPNGQAIAGATVSAKKPVYRNYHPNYF